MLRDNLKLMKHQQEAVDFAINNKGIAAFLHDPGTGKTISSLSTFNAFRIANPKLHLLVICPLSLIHGAWTKEIEKYTYFKWHDIHSVKGNHDRIYPPDIFIANFESLLSAKKHQEIINILSDGNDYMVVVDESSKMKNPQAATTEKLLGFWKKGKYTKGIKDYCKHRILCSGTPAPNTESEYFPQMKFLSDRILGDNFYKFRNKYFQMHRGKEIVPGAVFNKATLSEMFKSGYKYEFNPALKNEFFNCLKPWCHMVKAKDCLDLPEQVDEYRLFEMGGEQLRVYNEMKTQYIAEIKHEIKDKPSDFVVANIILTKMMKLRQVTGGGVIDENEKVHFIGKNNPKIDMLLDIVEECGQEQIIIWAQFRFEVEMIVKELYKIGKVSELHGGIPQDDRIKHIDNFINKDTMFLVAHPKSAGFGLTFVNCRYSVFFSMSYSYEDYEQCRARIHRKGQIHKCLYFHLIAARSVDEEVLAVCQRKATSQEVAERFLKSV